MNTPGKWAILVVPSSLVHNGKYKDMINTYFLIVVKHIRNYFKLINPKIYEET